MRLRLTRPPPREELGRLVERLAAIPGVQRVRARPNTGSVIVEWRGAESLRDALTERGILRLQKAPSPPSLEQSAQLGLMGLDLKINQSTDGAVTLRSALAMILLIAAAGQAARGKLVGPAATLAMTAFSLLDTGKK